MVTVIFEASLGRAEKAHELLPITVLIPAHLLDYLAFSKYLFVVSQEAFQKSISNSVCLTKWNNCLSVNYIEEVGFWQAAVETHCTLIILALKESLFVPKKRKSLVQCSQQTVKSGPTLIIMDKMIEGIISPLLVSMFHYTSCPVFSPIPFPALVFKRTLHYSSDSNNEKSSFPFKTEQDSLFLPAWLGAHHHTIPELLLWIM